MELAKETPYVYSVCQGIISKEDLVPHVVLLCLAVFSALIMRHVFNVTLISTCKMMIVPPVQKFNIV